MKLILVLALVAIFIFGCSKDKNNIAELIQQMQIADRTVQLNALVTLSKMGPKAKKALNAIGEVASNEQDDQLSKIASAARYLIDPLGQYVDKTTVVIMEFDPNILQGLIEMAKMEDSEIQTLALEAIGWRIVSPLESLPNWPIWGGQDINEAIDILMQCLYDKKAVVRRSASMSLAILGMYRSQIPAFRKTINVLQEAIKDRDILTRGFAKMALGYGGQTDDDTKAAAEEWHERMERFYQTK